MKKLLFLVLLFISIGFVLNAQTDIPAGEVFGTLSKAASPFKIKGDIKVASGQTLTIEPGVVIEFMGHYSVTVNGTMIAVGTLTDSIYFKVTSDSIKNGWNGIRYISTSSTSDSSKFAYCNFRYSKVKDMGGVFRIINFPKISIHHSTFEGNSSQTGYGFDAGGAIYCKKADIDIRNNIFKYNEANRNGGAICAFQCSPYIVNNKFLFNKSIRWEGGAIYLGESRSYVINNLFVGNMLPEDYTGYNGGGALCSDESQLHIINNTFVKNNSEVGGALCLKNGNDTVINSIFIGNLSTRDNSHQLEINSDTLFIGYCNIQGGTSEISQSRSLITYGLIVNDTNCFRNAATNDYSLDSASLCINGGEKKLRLESLDLAGNPRIFQGDYKIVDIGAYEYQGNVKSSNSVLVTDSIKDLGYQKLGVNITDTIRIHNFSSTEANIEVSDKANLVAYKNALSQMSMTLKAYADTFVVFNITPSNLGKNQILLQLKNNSNNSSSAIQLRYRGTNLDIIKGLTIGAEYTWPYDSCIVTRDIIVKDAGILKIPTGKVIYFSPNTGLTINGVIEATGTAKNRVVFSAPPDCWDLGWKGIYFVGNGTKRKSVIDFALIEYGKATTVGRLKGGALYIYNYDSLLVAHSILRNNYALSAAGAVYLENSNVQFYNNLIYKNYAYYGHNAIYSEEAKIKLINNTICFNIGNTSSSSNDAILFQNASYKGVVYVNNLLYGNSPGNNTGQVVFYGKCLDTISFVNSFFDDTISLSLDCVKMRINNCKYGDPRILNREFMDLRIQPASPCLNKGLTSTTLGYGNLDVFGNERVKDGVIDIGAFEYQGNLPPTFIKTIKDTLVNEGFGKLEYDLSAMLYDAESNAIQYKVVAADTNLITTTLSGSTVILNEKKFGKTTVQIKAWDYSNDTTDIAFNVRVNFVPKYKKPLSDTIVYLNKTEFKALFKNYFYDLDDSVLTVSADRFNNTSTYVYLQRDSIFVSYSKTGKFLFILTAIDPNKAVCTDTFSITVMQSPLKIPITETRFKISPNPVANWLSIESENWVWDKLRIYDLTGRVVLEKMQTNQGIDVSKLKAGTYIILFYHKGVLQGQSKIIKE